MTVNGVPVAAVRPSFGDVTGLPDAQPDTVFVVSALVRAAVPNRSDVASPGALVRDSQGNVTGLAALQFN
mgnify:CR=1 FL=1